MFLLSYFGYTNGYCLNQAHRADEEYVNNISVLNLNGTTSFKVVMDFVQRPALLCPKSTN
jgi:hypothetical protein